MSPEEGVYTPVMRLKSVVLPAPLGPMTETISPSATLNDRSVVAWRPPKNLLTLFTSSTQTSGSCSRGVGRAAFILTLVFVGEGRGLVLVERRIGEPGVLRALLVGGLVAALAQECGPGEFKAAHQTLGPKHP